MTSDDAPRALADAIDRAELASCVIDADGVVASMSPRLAGLLGLASGAGPGQRLSELLAGWRVSASLTDGLTLSREGDEVCLVEVKGASLSTGEGDVLAFFDVTSHHAARQELAELAQFPSKNPGPVLWLDRDATVIRANPAALRIFGTDIVGACWFESCPGLDEEAWEAARTATEPFVQDVDTDHGCFAMSYVASDDADFVFTFGADITGRREAEQRLADVARFPDMNPGPVLRLDLDGTILLANRAARDLFGAELTGSCWFDMLPAIATRWDEIRASRDPVPIETRFAQRDYQFTHRSDRDSGLIFVFGADMTEQKQAERGLQQAEKMATLGTLAAGVAHELNNPAAAARRAAEQLGVAFARLQDAQFGLDDAQVDPAVIARIRDLAVAARDRAARPSELDALTRSDLEAEVEDWLDDHEVTDEFDLAPVLVEQGITVEALDELAGAMPPDALGPTLGWIAAVFPVYRLAHEVGQASARISEIVGAMKGYSYLGQAARQEVDLHEGIDNTLIILRSKLKTGIEVTREYDPNMPSIPAFGSELNQVWTNLLDNAADAMGGTGSITITTSTDEQDAVVRICDDGPGIPADMVGRIFDPF
ncbi:MAG: ATP-binding protein, partial [Acidimicrobiia bacterium]|nr:ATP-binding protein [Acidimicrobiia bacterium]